VDKENYTAATVIIHFFYTFDFIIDMPKTYFKPEKLIGYQRHIINVRWKHDYLLGQKGNTDETQFF
jgi:hypothetical protein